MAKKPGIKLLQIIKRPFTIILSRILMRLESPLQERK